MRLEPRQRLTPCRCIYAQRGVRPGANGQVWLLSRVAQRAVVAQQPRQEDVVPAADQVYRDSDIFDGSAEVAHLPILITRRIVCEPFLEERGMPPGGQLIEVTQGQMGKERL